MKLQTDVLKHMILMAWNSLQTISPEQSENKKFQDYLEQNIHKELHQLYNVKNKSIHWNCFEEWPHLALMRCSNVINLGKLNIEVYRNIFFKYFQYWKVVTIFSTFFPPFLLLYPTNQYTKLNFMNVFKIIILGKESAF